MRRCSRCCLHYSIKMANLVMNLLGIAIIVYSLWLQKIWNIGAAQLPSYHALPKPCYIVSNWISNSVLCIYIISIGSLLLPEVVVDVIVFFKYDWSSVGVIALAIILWGIGIERISESRHLEIPEFTTSFLVGTGSGFLNRTTVTCGRCEVLRTGNPTRQSTSFFSYIRMVFRMQFQTRPILS
ncbi:hypothetical protein GQ457_12G020610 [Hibiscus cannabinus]